MLFHEALHGLTYPLAVWKACAMHEVMNQAPLGFHLVSEIYEATMATH